MSAPLQREASFQYFAYVKAGGHSHDMQTALSILIFVGIIVLPMVALFYGSKAIGWGFREYPKTTFAIMILIFLGLIFSVLGFGRLFPGCRAQYTGFRNIIYCEPQRPR